MIKQVTREETDRNCDQCGLVLVEGKTIISWRIYNGLLLLHPGCGLALSGRIYQHIKNSTDKDGRLIPSNRSVTPRRHRIEPNKPTFVTRER